MKGWLLALKVLVVEEVRSLQPDDENQEQNQTECERVQAFDTVAESVNDLTRYTGLALTIISFIFVPICAIYFIRRRREHPRLFQRNLTLRLAFCLAVLAYTILVPFRDFFGQKEFPCDVYALFSFLSFFLIITPWLVVLISLYQRIMFNQEVISLTFEALKSGRAKIFLTDLHWNEDASMITKSTRNAHDEVLKKLDRAVPGGASPENAATSQTNLSNFFKKVFGIPTLAIVEAAGCIAVCMAPFMYWITCWRHRKDVPRPLRLRYFLASQTAANFLLALFWTICGGAYFIYYAIIFAPFQGCTGCGVDKLYPLQLPVIALCTILGVGFVSALWEYPDNLRIKRELLVLLIMFVLCYIIIVPILNTATDKPEETGVWNWSFVSHVFLLAGCGYIFPYQVYSARKEMKDHGKRRSSLNEILGSDDGSKAFAVHLATELSLENLYFYKSAIAWKEKYLNQTDEDNKEDAKELYDLYFAPGATFILNLGAHDKQMVAEKVMLDICPIDIFDGSIKEVLGMMDADSFFRFKKSKYYKAYNNDLSLVEELL